VRVKIFSFPLSELSIAKAYELYSKALARSWKFHQHIGMCRYGELESTTHAIEIFKGVVQMGLEGIVIVDPSVQYGTMEDNGGDPANYFFKLKQKIVLPPTQIVQKGQICKYKDGAIAPPESEYALTIGDKEIKFSDQQPRNKDIFWHRLKYMEHVPGMKGFPCITGYRHMHFATPYDMSDEVPAAESLTRVSTVRHVLGVDYAIEKFHKDKMLNWDIEQEAQILEASPLSTRLFNPRPFAPQQSDYESTSTDRNNSAPGASASRVPKRSSSAVFSHKPSEPTRKISRWASGVWDNPDNPYTVKHNHGAASSKDAGSKDKESTEKEQEWCELSDSDNDDNDTKALEQENDSQPWPEPSLEDSEEVHKKWASRPPPRPEDPRAVQKAWDEMALEHYRKTAKEEAAREAAREAAKKKAAEEAARKEAIEEAAYQAFLKKAKEEA
jgi:hypothetical protein